MTGGPQKGYFSEVLYFSESEFVFKAKIYIPKVCKTKPVITFGL